MIKQNEKQNKTKRKKKTKKQKLIKKLDELVSKIVRKRDTRCLLCGSTENLQVHHYIVTKGHSTKYRWDLRNLITLCYPCHIHKVHSTASVKYVDAVKQSAIMNGIASAEAIEDIKHDQTIADFSTEELEKLVETFTELLNG